MNVKPDPAHLKQMQADITDLMSAGPTDPYRIRDFIKNPIYKGHIYQGIYVISDPDDKEPVYIGKTNDGDKEGLADRIYGHASNCGLKDALGIKREDFERYRVRAFRIDDPIRRGLAELYGIAIYKPKANKVARLQAIPSYDDKAVPP